MSRVKSDMSVIQCLSATDKQVLMAIYNHRCLDDALIYEYFYKAENPAPEFTEDRLDFFSSSGLIELVDYGSDSPACFLTTYGIRMVKDLFDIPEDTWDAKLGKIRPSMKTASKIKLAPGKIRHQIHLNSFVFRFKRLADENGLSYKYYDETFTRLFNVMRPDGIIELSSCDIFLEMDMATERADSLLRKWDHYRNFLKTKEYQYREKRMLIFFITGNVKRVRQRRDTVLSTLNKNLFDQISPNFDVYIGDEDRLIGILKDQFIDRYSEFSTRLFQLKDLLFHGHGFTSSMAYNLVTSMQEVPFDLYIRRLNERQNIMVKDGRAQEFLVDYYVNEPVSILQKIAFFRASAVCVQAQFGREIPYLVVVEDPRSIYRDLSVLDIRSVENVFFTTIQRLKTMTLCEAIFAFDGVGNMYHYTDDALNKPVFEQKMRI